MATYGPGYVTDNYFLANHEWPKHGSCTGLDAGGYFSKSIEALLALPGDEGTPALLREHVGGKVALSDLRTAFGPSENVVLSCDPRCNLAEVGVCFGVDGQGNPTAPMACPQNVMSGSSNSCVGNPSRPRCPTVSIQAAKNADDTGTGGGDCGNPGQGPACANDTTCQQQGYVRCARSGCCTTVPKR
jgi:ribonuclease T2